MDLTNKLAASASGFTIIVGAQSDAQRFYEWQQTPRGKQPYRIMLASGELFAFAGLWDRWKQPDGDAVESCCIVTCEPNELAARFHNRMPVIIET